VSLAVDFLLLSLLLSFTLRARNSVRGRFLLDFGSDSEEVLDLSFDLEERTRLELRGAESCACVGGALAAVGGGAALVAILYSSGKTTVTKTSYLDLFFYTHYVFIDIAMNCRTSSKFKMAWKYTDG
jgi:hypothetical protein